jgi:RHS repeat-associated protein
MDHLVQVVDRENGSVVGNHAYVWCGDRRCLETDLLHLDSSELPTVSAEYFAQGEVRNGQPFYYVKDGLGSVRGIMTPGGHGRGVIELDRYEYDALGNRTQTLGDASFAPAIGFAGYFQHAVGGASGVAPLLNLAVHRAYEADLGRWLTRDPLNPMGLGPARPGWRGFNATNLNLYAYVDNNPMSMLDPSGLNGIQIGLGAGAGMFWGFTGGFGLYVGAEGFGFYSYSGEGAYVGASADLAWEFQWYQGSDPAGPSTDLTAGAGVGPVDVNVSFNQTQIVSGASAGTGFGAAITVINSDTNTFGAAWPWVSPPADSTPNNGTDLACR